MVKLVHMDQAGRIVLPKIMRERLGFRTDSVLEAEERPDGIFIRFLAGEPTLVAVEGLLVHQGRAESGMNWEHMIEEAREERTQNLLGPLGEAAVGVGGQ